MRAFVARAISIAWSSASSAESLKSVGTRITLEELISNLYFLHFRVARQPTGLPLLSTIRCATCPSTLHWQCHRRLSRVAPTSRRKERARPAQRRKPCASQGPNEPRHLGFAAIGRGALLAISRCGACLRNESPREAFELRFARALAMNLLDELRLLERK